MNNLVKFSFMYLFHDVVCSYIIEVFFVGLLLCDCNIYRFPTADNFVSGLFSLHQCNLGRSKLKFQQYSKSFDHPVIFQQSMVKKFQ